MAAPVLQFKRGLLANLPGLRAGEPGFTTDSYDLYVGLTSETSTNKFFGSHRYWIKETTSTGSAVNLVEGTSNGSDYISIKSPDSLAGIVTYVLPGTQGNSSTVLTNDGSGNLSWASGSANPVFTGIATFSDTTDNTLGDSDTGAVQIDGGVGIDKNLTVGANLNIQGFSEFVGVSTFTGAIDANSGADISGGETILSSATVSDLTSGRVVLAGTSGALEDSANLTFDGSTLTVVGLADLDDVNVSSAATISGALDVNGGADISGGETTLSSATVSDLTDNRVVIAGTSGALEDDGNLTYDGTDLSTNSLIVTDLTDNRVLLAGSGGAVEDSGNLTFDGSTLTVVGYADLDDVNVSSAATIATADITNATIDNLTFTSGTAITSVDTDLSAVSASDDTLASAKAIKTYVDAQVTAQDLDIQGDTGGALSINLDSETLTIAGTANEIETLGVGNTITIGLPDNVVIGAGLTVTGALDVNGGGSIDNVQIGVSGDNEIDTSSGNLTIDSADGQIIIDDNLSVTGVSTFTGAIDANGGADISGGETTLSSATVSDLTSGRVVLAGTSGALEDSADLTFGASGLIVGANGINVTGFSTFSTDVNIGGDLTVGGNDIKASDGTTALTLADSTGAVTAASDLTVSGNLYVSGNTTQVNTAALTVEDRTIDLGIVNGAAPASATTWDLGVLFNYYTGGAAKKSAVVWEHGDARFKFASVLGADSNGTNNDTPQLSVTTFAPIEIGALWVTDCAGSSQVISCTGTERFLENITVDAGTF